jgi:hypothetical protein
MLRQLRQRLREQIPYLARRGLRHAMRRQAHEGITATRRPLPGAECRHGTTRRLAWQVKLSPRDAHVRVISADDLRSCQCLHQRQRRFGHMIAKVAFKDDLYNIEMALGLTRAHNILHFTDA